MKRATIEITGWFEKFETTTQHDGYLPELGTTSLEIDTLMATELKPGFASFERQIQNNSQVFGQQSYHLLRTMVICFWAGVRCQDCGADYTAHSLMAKRGHLLCDMGVRNSQSHSNKKAMVMRPKIDYQAVGSQYCVIPMHIQCIDRRVLKTWDQIHQGMDQSRYFSDPTAILKHARTPGGPDAYWALHCPHCMTAQEDESLKPSPGKTELALAACAMGKAPDLMVVPTQASGPLFSGIMRSDVFFHTLPNS